MKIIGITILLVCAFVAMTVLMDYKLDTHIEILDQLNPLKVPEEFEFVLVFFLLLFLGVQFYITLQR
ncbi:hypothetical protein [Bacillus sp. Marseille-Q3570]|uniref:hypothetical protein n=1 Tax=Bacillus sp. Marseille-Q3570 TaxID=2963522 RepID=UPI0021B72E1A|nr:hypothetical protein [Bacillus sp. Marseille-Q3570]